MLCIFTDFFYSQINIAGCWSGLKMKFQVNMDIGNFRLI